MATVAGLFLLGCTSADNAASAEATAPANNVTPAAADAPLGGEAETLPEIGIKQTPTGDADGTTGDADGTTGDAGEPSSAPPKATVTVSAPSPTLEPVIHTVMLSESINTIAALYPGTSVDSIVAVNGLANPNMIHPGQELLIPVAGSEAGQYVEEANADILVTQNYTKTTFGHSTNNMPLYDYAFGSGPVHVALVGGIHGGYEWNTVALAYQAIEYMNRNPTAVPVSVTLHILPNMNPDGVMRVSNQVEWITADNISDFTTEGTIAGRFNGRDVDLNRNWGCNWSPDGEWRNQAVDSGSEPFSEVENQAVRDHLLNLGVEAVVFWHSASGLVAPGRCNDVAHPGSDELAQQYGQAAGYAVQPFLSYEVTGDASDWFAEQGIPSVSVELTDHYYTEWEKNLMGILAVMDHYAGLAGAERE